MPNVFNLYTSEQVGEVVLHSALVGFRLSDLVKKYGPADFKPGRGSTVYLNVPAALITRDRTIDETAAAIVVDSLAETQEPIALSTHAYNALALSEADISLNIKDFAKQVLAPQADAVVDRIENAVATVLAGVSETNSAALGAVAYDATKPVKSFTAARNALRLKGLDVANTDGLVMVVGSKVADDLLDSGVLDYANTGTDRALRQGELGNVRGFETVESTRVGANDMYAFPREAIYLAVRAPEVPQGATYGAKVSKDSFGIRYLMDYDADHTVDRSIVSTFVGAGIMPSYKVVRNYTTNVVTASKVTGGHIVRFDVSTAPVA